MSVTEPTTEELVVELAAIIDPWAMAYNGYSDLGRQKKATALDTATRIAEFVSQRLSDLEGKLGEEQKARQASHQALLDMTTLLGRKLGAAIGEKVAAESKLGEARKALTSAESQIITLYTSISRGDPETGRRFAQTDPAMVEIRQALKLTASGGGDNSLSQGASVAHPSVRPDEPHPAGGEQ